MGMTATLVDHDPALLAFAEQIGTTEPIAVRGAGTRWGLGGASSAGTRVIAAPTGIVSYQPEEMTVRVRAGTSVSELNLELAARGQRTALPDRGGTVGGALAVGENDVCVAGRSTVRSSLLQVRYVSAEGRVVNGGGPTVKNVTGFDLPRIMVGSLGTLGLLAEAIIRTNPIPAVSVWLTAHDVDPFVVFDALQHPSAVLWNGATTWVQLEGHAADVAAERAALSPLARFTETERPPSLPEQRWSLTPSAIRTLDHAHLGDFVAVIGVGMVFATRPQPVRSLSAAVREVHDRLKGNFDPTGRLNPGRDAAAR
jgi:FAD/FMN-containing dehydrogenase